MAAGLVIAVLVGPLPQDSGGFVTPTALKAEYTSLMSEFASRRRPEPTKVVPPLCELHRQLTHVEGVSPAERRRLLRGIEHRLAELHRRLQRDRLAGGAAAAHANELIRLIQTTIAPESWDANGGRGTILFWGANPALVIRASGEAHHQVGQAMQGLRR
jgi:hypothetical protein